MPKLCFFSFFFFFYHLPPILACTRVGERGRCGTLDGEYHNDIIHMQPGLGNPSDAETKTIEKKKGGVGRWIIEEHQRNRKPSLWIGSTFWECFKEHSIVGRKKKKNSLRFIPRQKKALPWLRGGRVHRWKLTYCSPFICMKLFTAVSCCSVFLFVFFFFMPVPRLLHFSGTRIRFVSQLVWTDTDACYWGRQLALGVYVCVCMCVRSCMRLCAVFRAYLQLDFQRIIPALLLFLRFQVRNGLKYQKLHYVWRQYFLNCCWLSERKKKNWKSSQKPRQSGKKKCTVFSVRSAQMVNSDGGEASRFARSREVGRAPTRSLGENRWQPPKAGAKLFCSRARTSPGHFQPGLNLYLRPLVGLSRTPILYLHLLPKRNLPPRSDMKRWVRFLLKALYDRASLLFKTQQKID